MSSGQMTNFVEQATAELLDGGEYDLLSVARNLKVMRDLVTSIEKNIKSYVLDEAVKHGKTFEYDYAVFTLKIRNSADWKTCNDSTLKLLEVQLKARKKMLQNISSEMADL